MKRVLLDTHIWIWYLVGDARLPAPHKTLIESEETDVWLSPISAWEAHLLIENSRLRVAGPADQWVREALRAMQVREAPLTFKIAQRSRTIGLSHPDPADRFLAATAAEMELVLLTVDERMLACKEFASA